MRFTLLLSILLLTACRPAPDQGPVAVRVATFNAAMGLSQAGELGRRLSAGKDRQLQQLAAIIQQVRPDLLLLNEFDYDPATPAAELLQQQYLSRSQFGQTPIEYPYAYTGPVNTGVDSGLDLNSDGNRGTPADAWGFGVFPGQYGMLVLSRYPIDAEAVRSFQTFPWQAMPGAKLPTDPDSGEPWYPTEVEQALRLSSKSHWDIPLTIAGRTLHFLVLHPTPPVFDGPEDRNGLRNHAEIKFIADYIDPQNSAYIRDDSGRTGGLQADALFVVAGDLNADPYDGDSDPAAIRQLLNHSRVNEQCVPRSHGAMQAYHTQGGINLEHEGDPEMDTGDFNDQRVGNLRLDYVLPSTGIETGDCGVFWPAAGEAGADWISASDHRMVWADLILP